VSGEREILDILDYRGRVVGTADRETANTTGLLHLCSQVWIVAPEGFGGSGPALFFQKRSPQKRVAPGLYDATACGHVQSGETAKRTAIAEANEEVGIELADRDISYLGRRFDQYQEGPIDSRAFVDVFLAVLDRSEINFRLQTEELDDMAEISVEEGMAFFSGEKDELGATLMGANADSSWAAKCALAESDFIYRHDRYYYKVCHAAHAKLNGLPLPSI
jgi:isopentenyldiphosphate isomerase